MKTFEFFFGVGLGEMKMCYDIQIISARPCRSSHSQQVVVRTLQALRGVDLFDLFCTKVTKNADSELLEVDEPHLP